MNLQSLLRRTRRFASFSLPALIAATGLAATAAPDSASATVTYTAESEVDDAGIERGVRGAVNEAQRFVTQAARVGKAVAFGLAAGPGPSILVIPGAGAAPDSTDSLTEDLAVMNRILAKVVKAESEGRTVTYDFGFRRDFDALYLEGFGALFFVRVDFPLVEPARTKAVKEPEPADTTWEETRRELQESRRGGGEAPFGWIGRHMEPAVEFDAQRVDDLKQAIIPALKHAANVKGVRPDETIAVAVLGPVPREESKPVGRNTRGGRRTAEVRLWNSQDGEPVQMLASDGGESRAASVMTFRVKKSDAEAFAKGRLSAEEFAKKVSVTVR